MRVRMSSYILACFFTLFGLWCLVAMPRLVEIFSAMQMQPPLFTRVILAPTAVFWLLISLTFAALVIWKDLRPRPWLRTSAFAILLAVQVLIVVTPLFQPILM